MVPNVVYQLDTADNLPLQVLKLAGWEKGRKYDISENIQEYARHGYRLTEHAKDVLAEYYGLFTKWRFNFAKNNKPASRDFLFEVSGPCLFAKQSERQQLPAAARVDSLPLIATGFDKPRTVWLSKSGCFYHTDCENCAQKYDSILDLLHYELHFECREVFVTFASSGVMQ